MYQTHFLHIGDCLSPGRGSRLRGTQGGRVYTRRKFGPRLGSMARGVGVQSRARWQVVTGSLSADPKSRKTMEDISEFFALLLPKGYMRLPSCAGLVGTKLCAGRVWLISTLHVGPDQPDPNPLGGSGSAGAATRLRRVFWWRFSKKTPGGRKASLNQ